MKILEYHIFKNPKLYEQARTPSAFANDEKTESYQRLEWLGDGVLKLAVSDYLYDNYPLLNQGELTALRQKLENEDSLSEVFDKNNLLENIEDRLRNLKVCELSHKTKSDFVESFIGAIYKDSDLQKAKEFINKLGIYKLLEK